MIISTYPLREKQDLFDNPSYFESDSFLRAQNFVHPALYGSNIQICGRTLLSMRLVLVFSECRSLGYQRCVACNTGIFCQILVRSSSAPTTSPGSTTHLHSKSW